MLGSVITDQIVIADLEAGIGTLTRLAEEVVDAVVVVVEPTPRSLEIGARALALAGERGIGRVVIVANRIHDEADRQRVAAVFEHHDIAEIAHDPAIVAAERAGVAPIDHAPDSHAVRTVAAVARGLVAPPPEAAGGAAVRPG